MPEEDSIDILRRFLRDFLVRCREDLWRDAHLITQKNPMMLNDLVIVIGT